MFIYPDWYPAFGKRPKQGQKKFLSLFDHYLGGEGLIDGLEYKRGFFSSSNPKSQIRAGAEGASPVVPFPLAPSSLAHLHFYSILLLNNALAAASVTSPMGTSGHAMATTTSIDGFSRNMVRESVTMYCRGLT